MQGKVIAGSLLLWFKCILQFINSLIDFKKRKIMAAAAPHQRWLAGSDRQLHDCLLAFVEPQEQSNPFNSHLNKTTPSRAGSAGSQKRSAKRCNPIFPQSRLLLILFNSKRSLSRKALKQFWNYLNVFSSSPDMR